MVLSLEKQRAPANAFQKDVAENLDNIMAITQLVADRAAFTPAGRSLSRNAIEMITGRILADIANRKLSPAAVPGELDRMLSEQRL